MNVSANFFEQLPHGRRGSESRLRHTGGGGRGRATRTFEAVLKSHKADLVVVVGDANSALAFPLVGAKRGNPAAYLGPAWPS